MTPLLPTTYQKLNAAWLDHERVPKTTRASPSEQRLEQRPEVGRAVLEVGVENRSPVPGGVLEAGLQRRSLAAVALVLDDRHLRRPLLRREQLARPVRRAVVDDHELARVDGKLCGQRVVDRRLDGRELVEHRHEDGKRDRHPRHRTAIGSWCRRT